MSGATGTLGKYQIIREIARSNDIVYEAYDPVMNRRVALKELAIPQGTTSQQQDDRRSRFLREARAAGTLTHPNIVTVYEYGEDSGRHFIAMEYLDGHTLRNEIDTKGFLPPNDAIRIANEVLEGLDYAHKNGVIHRDVKPENIQLLPDGRVKLTDFGIARLTFEPNLTMDGQVFGTPSYMSPEQVVGKDIDIRSDLFSVGVVLYEMIAGKKPFGGDSVVAITYAIMNSHPDQPTQANWAVWQLLEQALDKSPQLRFASATAMRDAAEAALKASSAQVIDPNAYQTGGYGTQTGNYGSPLGQSQAGPPPLPNQTPYGTPIYGPGGAVGGTTPYGAPTGQQPPPLYGTPGAVPPQMGQTGGYGSQGVPTYGYNPYSPTGQPIPQGQYPQGQYPQASYPQGQQPGQPPGYTVAPIYYPAPPRGPLVKPETSAFLRKLFVAMILIGTFFGLVIVLIQVFTASVERMQRQGADRVLREDLTRLDAKKPIDLRIDEVKGIQSRLQDPENKDYASEKLAELQLEKADALFKAGQIEESENLLSEALANNPENAAIHVKRAQVYESLARQSGDVYARQTFWIQAAASWVRAGELVRDPVERQKVFDKGVDAYMALSREFMQDGQYNSARQSLESALVYVEKGSRKAEEVSRALSQIPN